MTLLTESIDKVLATRPQAITWTHTEYGRAGDLDKLNRVRNDHEKSDFFRWQADRSYARIREQLKDKQLMQLRLRLIKATQAGDRAEAIKITKQMRDYLGEDTETGQAEDIE